jgi:hypothetical protein
MSFWEFYRAARFALDHPWYIPEWYWRERGWPADWRTMLDEEGRVIRYNL